MRGTSHPDVSVDVVIPHLSRAQSLCRTLDSLSRQSVRPEVIVCDNGSTDDSVDMLRADFPWVCCVELGTNLGFGAAVNRGLECCSGDLVVLLNNDCVAEPDLVERLVEAWRSSGAEMIAACLRMPHGPIESVGIELDRSLIAYDLWWGRDYQQACEEPPPEPLAPCAGAAAYERRALHAVGAFDEAFFAYLEDVDLGLRMRAAGMRCVVAPDAIAWHEHSGTLGSGSTAKNHLMGASRARIAWKHGRLMRPSDRLRGWLLDGITYAGQALIDRNLGAARGRLEAWRELRTARSPEPAAELRRLLVDKSFRASLGARLGRRQLRRSGHPRSVAR